MKIKVNLVSHKGSGSRGIGFYEKYLAQSLLSTGKVEFSTLGSDIIHYPFFDLFYHSLPLIKLKPTIVTIHDLTPLVMSKYYPVGIRGRLNFFFQKLSLRGVNAIITDSENSRRDTIKILNINPSKIFVTPLACDGEYAKVPSHRQVAATKKKYHLPDRFLLFVGGINVNKNLLTLIKASLKANIPLVLVGGEFTKPVLKNTSIKNLLGLQVVHPEVAHVENIKMYLKEFSQNIRTLGFVSNQELNHIYRLATAYVQPSFYEGFGLPLLEAMTTGCLTISSKASSLPEIYPKGSITFNPDSQAELIQAINRVLKLSLRERTLLRNDALARASDFSWNITASKTLSIYQKVYSRSI